MARSSSAALKTLTRSVAVATAAFGAWGIAVAAQRDAQQRGLQAMLGSAKEAERVMTRMRAVSLQPGVTFDAGLSLATSLMAVKVNADLAVDAVGNFGNALALAGRGEEELQRVGLALSQIVSKGKVSAEEINQLAEAVPQIRDVMVNVFGTADTEKLQKDLEAAGVSAKQFVELLVEGFTPGGLVAKATDTFSNKLVNLKAAFRDLAASFGSAFASKSGSDALDAFTKTIQDLAPAMKALGQAAASALPAIAKFIGNLLNPATIAAGVGKIAEFLKMLQQIPARVDSWTTMAADYLVAFGALVSDIVKAIGQDLQHLAQRAQTWLGVIGDGVKAAGRYVVGVGKAVMDWFHEFVGYLGRGSQAIHHFIAGLDALASGNIRGAAKSTADALRSMSAFAKEAFHVSGRAKRAGDAFAAGMDRAAQGWEDFRAEAKRTLVETEQAQDLYQQAQQRFLAAIDNAKAAHRAAADARRAEAAAAGNSAAAAANAAMAAKQEAAAQEEVTSAIVAQNAARQKYLDLLEQQRIIQERLLQQAKQTVANSAARAMAAEDRLNARGRGIGSAQARNSFRFIAPMAYREVDNFARIAGENLTPQERDKRAIQAASGMFGQVSANTSAYDAKAREAEAKIKQWEILVDAGKISKEAADQQIEALQKVAEEARAMAAAIEEGFRQQQERIQQSLQRTGQTIDAIMTNMESLAQAESEQRRAEEEAIKQQRDPRSISITMSGGSEASPSAGLNDRLTASALGNLGLGSEAILAQARMDQQGRIIADATSGAMMPFTRVIVQAIREGIGRATRTASAMTAAAEGAI